MPDLPQNSSPLGHCAGLIFGFVFREGRGLEVRDETLAAAIEPGYDWVWLHLALSDHRARRFLEHYADCPDEARKMVTGGEERMQIHLTAGGGHGVLPDLEKDFDDEWLGPGRFGFWLDTRHLITARRHPLSALELMRDAVKGGLSPSDPAECLVELNLRYLEMVESRIHSLSRELDRIEDQVLGERSALDGLKLGPLRRELTRHTREFAAFRSAILRAKRNEVESPLSDWLPALLQDVEDHDRDASALLDRARLIYEEVNTRISAVTNRSLSALTVISTLLLPPTFVVGAFGMNVGGLPWMQDKEGFYICLGLCLLLVAASYLLLRRFRILP
jgi:zinc transporter